MANPQTLYVTTLGHFDIRHGGRRINLVRQKEKALVAYLTVNRDRRFTREYLADLFWEHSNEGRARHSLNQALYAIRRLAPDLIHIDGPTVSCCSERVRSDLDEIADSIQRNDVKGALSVLQGEFLSDLILRNCSEFEHWRSNYNRHFLSHLDVLVEKELQHLTIELREKLLLGCPRCVFQLLPSTHMPMHPEVRLPDDNSQGQEPREAIGGTDVVHEAPFVGRKDEITQLGQAWRIANSQLPQFLVVTGLAGYGKTRLIEKAVSELVKDDAIVAAQRCYESERKIAFGPIANMLTSVCEYADLQSLDDIWLSAIGEFFPALKLHSRTPPELSVTASQNRLFEAILRVLSRASTQKPVLWFLDDVQWADNSTKALLAYLQHHLERAKLLVVVAHRTKSSNGSLSIPWREWYRIDVPELSPSDVSSLLAKLNEDLEPPLFNADDIGRLTGGHPYLLTELVRCILNGDVPSVSKWQQLPVLKNVDEFVGALLRSLPSRAQRVIAALAILARPASFALVRRVTRVKGFHDHLDLVISRNIAVNNNGQISLRHDLIREVAYRQIPLFTRTELHRRAGDSLSRSKNRVGEAAEHYHRAQMRSLAYAYAIRAYRRAERKGAHDESVSYLRLAISSRSRNAALRYRLAERLYRAHRFSEAKHEVAYLLSRSTLPESKALRLRLLSLELAFNDGVMSRDALAELITEIRARPPERVLLGPALRLKARSVYNSGNQAAIRSCIQELQDFGGTASTAQAVEALAFAARLKSLVDSSIEAERWMLPVFSAMTVVRNEELRIRLKSLIATVAYEVGKLIKAEESHRDILRQIDAIGAITLWPQAACHTHMLLVEQGKYADALILETSIRKRAKPVDALHSYAVLTTNAASMYYEMGDFAKAKTSVTEARDYVTAIEAAFLQMELWGLHGLIALELGDVRSATTCASAGRELLEKVSFRAADVSYLEVLVSRIDTLHHRRSEAIRRLRDAVDDYRERDVVCRLRMQLELASLLRKSGSVDAARAEAKTVFHTATAINARPIAERADSLLTRM